MDWKQQIPISSAVSSPQILKPFKLTHLSTNIHYFHTFFFRFVVGLYLYISTEFISKLVMSNHNSSSLIHCKIESG